MSTSLRTTAAAHVEQLRADADRPGVSARAWALLHGLQDEAGADPEGVSQQLAQLFRGGLPSAGIDGATEGMFVTPLIQPGIDRVLRALTGRWMPWLGKRFDAERGTGGNRLASSARWPAKLLWPRYSMTGHDGELAAFRFRTRTEAGALGDDVDVLVIDYASVDENPDRIIRQVRDELVRLVGDVHLGRILYRWRGDYELTGYFALRGSRTDPR